MNRDVFDEVIAERDALREQVATLTAEVEGLRLALADQQEEFKHVNDERNLLEQQIATLTQSLVEHQRHRDHWRMYAYGVRSKPNDFLDGNMVPRPLTLIEMSAQAQVDIEAKVVRLTEALDGCVCSMSGWEPQCPGVFVPTNRARFKDDFESAVAALAAVRGETR